MVEPSNTDGKVTLAVLGTKLDYLIVQVKKVEDCVTTNKDRLDKVEGAVRILKWVGGTIGLISSALLIAWLKAMLGF